MRASVARGAWVTGAALAVTLTSAGVHAQELLRITMEEAVTRALARNPTYEVEREEIRRAQALVEQARAQSLPTLFAGGSYTRIDNDRVFNGNVLTPKGVLGLGVTLTVPLVSPRAWANWSESRDLVTVARTTADDGRRVIAVATGHAYLDVFLQKRVLDANLHARDEARGHYDYAHARFVGGAGNRLDEVRAAQEVAADEALVEASRAAIVRAQEALSILIGVDVPVDSAEEPRLPEPPPLPAAIDMATRARSDVLEASARKEAARHVRRDTWTDYSPSITGTFQPFYQDPPTFDTPTTGWQAQLLLTTPIYDGGLRCGLQHERESIVAETETQREGAVRQARSDVRAAFATMVRANESLAQAATSSRLAAEALGLANIAYHAGATTDLEVIDAERAARDAETQLEVAADTARQARLDMLGAAGRFP